MSKQYKIRRTEADNQRLRRLTKNYNAKLTRLAKKGYDKDNLPGRVAIKDLNAQITTRQDYNRIVKQLEGFLVRGAEKTKLVKVGETGEDAIRLSKADLNLLTSTAKSFRSKVNRLIKKDPKLKTALPNPDDFTVKQLKKNIGTRGDLMADVESMQRFLQPGANEIITIPGKNNNNLKITKWQKEEAEIMTEKVNIARAQRLKEIFNLEATSRGEGLGYTLGDIGMTDVDKNALLPMKPYYGSESNYNFDKRYRTLMKESKANYWRNREIALKNNVIKGILANYQDEFAEDAQAIVDAINEMSFEDFYRKFKAETGEMELVSPEPGTSSLELLARNINALKSHYIPKNKPEE